MIEQRNSSMNTSTQACPLYNLAIGTMPTQYHFLLIMSSKFNLHFGIASDTISINLILTKSTSVAAEVLFISDGTILRLFTSCLIRLSNSTI